MSLPLFQTPGPLADEILAEQGYDDEEDREDDRCRSLRRTTLHKDGLTVYLRCEATAGHTGKNHRSKVRKWTTEEEDGRLS